MVSYFCSDKTNNRMKPLNAKFMDSDINKTDDLGMFLQFILVSQPVFPIVRSEFC